jgi:hypothetical protein
MKHKQPNVTSVPCTDHHATTEKKSDLYSTRRPREVSDPKEQVSRRPFSLQPEHRLIVNQFVRSSTFQMVKSKVSKRTSLPRRRQSSLSKNRAKRTSRDDGSPVEGASSTTKCLEEEWNKEARVKQLAEVLMTTWSRMPTRKRRRRQ